MHACEVIYPVIIFGKSNRILGGLHLFTELISGAGANVSESRAKRARAVMSGHGTRYRISGGREGSTDRSGINLCGRVLGVGWWA